MSVQYKSENQFKIEGLNCSKIAEVTMIQSRLYKSVRIALIFLNLNFVVFSFILIIFGVNESFKSHLDKYSDESLTSTLPPSPSHILITLGVITIVSGAFGLRSVDNYCLLLSYMIFVILLSILDLSIGISASFMENSARETIATGFNRSLHDYNRSGDPQPDIDWDRMQSDLKCCGVYGHTDWSEGIGDKESSGGSAMFPLFKSHAVVGIPGSCFLHGEGMIREEDLNREAFVEENVFQEGCLVKAVDELGIGRLQRIGFILATGKVCAGVAAGLLANSIRNPFSDFMRDKY